MKWLKEIFNPKKPENTTPTPGPNANQNSFCVGCGCYTQQKMVRQYVMECQTCGTKHSFLS